LRAIRYRTFSHGWAFRPYLDRRISKAPILYISKSIGPTATRGLGFYMDCASGESDRGGAFLAFLRGEGRL
jgi:hypothetical protein